MFLTNNKTKENQDLFTSNKNKNLSSFFGLKINLEFIRKDQIVSIWELDFNPIYIESVRKII